MNERKLSLIFLLLSILFLSIVITVRITENEWYNNIEGQCGINDNGTCEGWQLTIIVTSLTLWIISLAAYGIIKSRVKIKGKL